MGIELRAFDGLQSELVELRRGFHKRPEPGWCEFQTAGAIIKSLRSLGLEVVCGREAVAEGARMGVPAAAELRQWFERARSNGLEPEILSLLEGGFTGVIGILRGPAPGPVVAIRFDIDANLGMEAAAPEHFPAAQRFNSTYPEAHHNCGHDGHAAIGLKLAEILSSEKENLRGEIRLIFQPAEEGLRGAASMVVANALDGVEMLLGCHIGVQALEVGEIVAGYGNILGSVKLNADFIGRAAHAAISPQIGRNALLAACTATQNLFAISQHGEGETRINVGILRSGVSRNTVPPSAHLEAEVRGETAAIVRHLEERARQVFEASAAMYDLRVEIGGEGASCPAGSSKDAVDCIRRAAAKSSRVTRIREVEDFKACDDMAVLMDAVQSRGGKAVYFGLGSRLADVHHTPGFDFDEDCLGIGLEVMLLALAETGSIQFSGFSA